MIQLQKFYEENKKLCEKNPDVFMICPRCNGTKYETIPEWSTMTGSYIPCSYCNGEGVISWIDRIIREKKNPFLKV